jgi:hypothetical protein
VQMHQQNSAMLQHADLDQKRQTQRHAVGK